MRATSIGTRSCSAGFGLRSQLSARSADLVVTPDVSGGPRVVVYEGGDFTRVANFFGIDDPNFRGGCRPACGDIDLDGNDDLAFELRLQAFVEMVRAPGYDLERVLAFASEEFVPCPPHMLPRLQEVMTLLAFENPAESPRSSQLPMN